MTAAEACALRLKQVAAVTALVSQRIYVFEVPQSLTHDAILVRRVSTAEFMHLRGAITMYRSRVQIDSIALKASGVDAYASARAIDAAVFGDGSGSSLVGWSGVLGGSPGQLVQAVIPVTVSEGYDPNELRQVRIMRDVYVWHEG